MADDWVEIEVAAGVVGRRNDRHQLYHSGGRQPHKPVMRTAKVTLLRRFRWAPVAVRTTPAPTATQAACKYEDITTDALLDNENEGLSNKLSSPELKANSGDNTSCPSVPS